MVGGDSEPRSRVVGEIARRLVGNCRTRRRPKGGEREKAAAIQPMQRKTMVEECFGMATRDEYETQGRA